MQILQRHWWGNALWFSSRHCSPLPPPSSPIPSLLLGQVATQTDSIFPFPSIAISFHPPTHSLLNFFANPLCPFVIDLCSCFVLQAGSAITLDAILTGEDPTVFDLLFYFGCLLNFRRFAKTNLTLSGNPWKFLFRSKKPKMKTIKWAAS